MSFYGNQYLELKNFFYRLLLKKNEKSITPNSDYDTLTIDSDDWINIKETDDEKEIKFEHKDSAFGKAVQFSTFAPCNDTAKKDTADLIHEGCVSSYTLKFDEKGHIIGATEQHYQLPDALRWRTLPVPAATTTEE